MRNILIFLLTCFVLTANAQDESKQRTIQVKGNAVLFAEPDEVLIDLNINNKASSLIEARKANETAAKRIISFLRKENIPNKHIQTEYVRVGEVRKHRSEEIDHYSAYQTIKVCLSDISKYDRMIDELIGLGIARVGRPTFYTTKRKMLEKEGRKIALMDAHTKAKEMAAVFGQKVGLPVLIKETSNFVSTHAGDYGSNFDSPVDTPPEDFSFAKGQLQLKSQVFVEFILE